MPIDARWNTSYGIKFSNTPTNQTWQPSQGITSSPSNPARQPCSTVPRNRDRIIPNARPYQPPSSSKSHGLELFASGVAPEDDRVVDKDEDIGQLHERASRQSDEISAVAAGYSEQATAAAANVQGFRFFGQSKARLANGSLMHDKFCRQRDRQFLDKPSSCIKRRRRARWGQRTLRSFLWNSTSLRSEQQEYYAQKLEFGRNRLNVQATTVLERDKNHAGCCELSRTSEKPLDCRTSERPSPNRQAVKAIVDGRLNSWSSQKRALHCVSLCSPDATEELGGTFKSSSLSTNNACSPLGFRIADPAERASQSSRDTKPLLWEYSLYRGPLGEKVKVHYCKSLADTERIARHFFDQEVIGFDIEWKSNASAKEGIKKNVALIQIASEERIALFHIARFRGEDTVDNLVPETFKYIMQSPRITKVGVSIKADCTRLRRFMGIESRGLFELSHLYKLVKYSPNDAGSVDKRLVRLATQVEDHLGLPLWKGQDVRSSDWSADLNYEQVQCKQAWP